ncbi:MAG: molybdopterin-synthase adenylyltransferase MoeB [Gammaproteobacteria bacterium]|nr:molybdopterin-synthase adenylyltransferase MoeB [Gammaproteobacteria bacterium]
MDDDQLLRFSRQILLPQIDIAGQEKLLAGRVLIVGLGGLGSPVALYLAAAGVGSLLLADPDRVDLSNLQRQIAYGLDDVGYPKVESACRAIQDLNPDCRVQSLPLRADAAQLGQWLGEVDLVVDCSDNFATRFGLNQACRQAGLPLVSGAAIRWEGQVAVFSGQPGDACYRCLYPDTGEDEQTCSNSGVISPLVGVIGSLQALEAIKLLSGCGEPLINRLLIFDGLRADWRSLRLKPDPACPVCSPTPHRTDV